MPGGYIGVDVFFVISGYLITSIIIRDFEAGTFRLRDFWERRARRILPALIVVLIVSVGVGWFLFLPDDFLSLGESVLAQAAFLQNIVFWRDSGYFSAPSEAKPLLHTWSLAVEEQFYLGLPIILIFLRRWKLGTMRKLAVLAGIFSFALGIAGLRYFPSAAFYLLPARAWELLAGVCIALSPINKISGWIRELGSGLGLAMILLAGFVLNAETPFPGWAALLPVGGTTLFIFYTRQGATLSSRLLALKPLVFIGLISYSLYLWHWPILVFFKTWSLAAFTSLEKFGLVGLAFGLAVFSWRFVETPVRRHQIFPTRRSVVRLATGCLAFCLIVGLSVIYWQGVPERLSPTLLRYAQGSQDSAFLHELKVSDVQKGALVPFGKKDSERVDIVVWGDSLAMAILPGLDQFCEEHDLAGMAATHSATPPLRNFVVKNFYSLKEEGIPFAEGVIDFVQKNQPRHVILTAAWSGYLNNDNTSEFSDALSHTISVLAQSGAKVWVVTEPPRHHHHIPKILSRRELFGIEADSLLAKEKAYREQQKDFDRVCSELVNGQAQVIDISRAIRDGKGGFIIDADGYPLYRDHIHLSTRGAKFVRKAFDPLSGNH
ncbi:MAG: acyltransferase family protein [Chthoniobacterales bacterium]